MPIVETIQTHGVPVHVYATDLDAKARQQLVELAESGIAVGYVAAMPDTHYGKGATIGSVFASDTAVCPNAVGVDIGCGVAAVRLSELTRDMLSEETLRKIQALIKIRVPTGFDTHARPQDDDVFDRPKTRWLDRQINDKTRRQLGSLGGGNHFIEVVHDDQDRVWAMLHSGSRGIGHTTAEHYTAIAQKTMRTAGITPRNADLWYLAIDSEDGQEYLTDMTWCQEYALANRRSMLNAVTRVVQEVTGHGPAGEAINIHHNFCRLETHSYIDPASGQEVTRDVWVTRKGATPADAGLLGLIPGSMATGSYVVEGLGNELSWRSCSHGAGRKKSRTAALREISQEEFVASMTGIVADTDEALRDEAPQAYKDLDVVMANQIDLVRPVTRLLPLINVKGVDKGKPLNIKSNVKFINETGMPFTITGVERAKSQDVRGKMTVEFAPPEEFKMRVRPHMKGSERLIWMTAKEWPGKRLLRGVITFADESVVEITLRDFKAERR